MKKKTLLWGLILAASTSVWAAGDTKSAPEKKSPAVAKKESVKPITSTAAKDWAYLPVNTSVPVPDAGNSKWVRSPIDNFVLARLNEYGLKPSEEADRATYIRRVTLDLLGLLPTPAEVEAFEKDKSPDAYEKLVDRLLASPHFGERQARRWLDLARYADSAGFQNDQTRPNNWRYRDYVIKSFNDDKPFNQFVREQIAGDEIWPDSQEAKIATGLLAGYPDNFNSRDLVQRHYQIATDMTDLVGETFLASTIGCARCHNHKIDKISQVEYFQLQAFFANTFNNERIELAKGSETQWDIDFITAQSVYQAAIKPITDQQKAILDQVREKGRKYHNERYLTDSREAIFKPKEQWTPLDKWVNARLNAVASERDIAGYLRETSQKGHSQYDPANVERWAEYEKLTEELKKYDNLRPRRGSKTYTALTELGTEAPATHVRFNGIHERPLEAVEPGLPKLWAGNNTQLQITPTATSTGRRTALANWLVSEENPLTTRVYVNRVWAQLFAKGIAGIVEDFGRAGEKPTHPELLDYLAADFVKNGWSPKKLQREIVLSAVYRQSSEERADVVAVDPANKLLAVYPRKRLEAEELRDSLLYASGELDETIGGPAVFPKVPSSLVAGNVLNNGQGGALWEDAKDPNDHKRRSIYTFVRRSLPYPLTASFDPADPSKPHHKRDVSTTALQALTLFNSDVVFGWSQALAGRVISEAGANENAQLDTLYEILFSRKPTREEKSALKGFLKEQEKLVESKAWTDKFEVAVPTGLKDTKNLDPFKAAAFVDLVHAVANSNEFAYRF
ncbi:DUF1549 and DUF1553 domain-containing protein [Cellvibrio fibrivorans]|uniref:DUF1553 domain-containing protein n=1 Tax=Cellvibrio fibrivorans TaxID=126350 RepID=A0ABU1UY02_9GAMM|nr:DUF1549 and DUF1553 domain-containing protein [Cellvibrio fibrivorans]MDR7090062.1 hypothetical protein [Cellvibrio fibrivorans]